MKAARQSAERPAPPAAVDPTRAKLLEAAGRVFADHGFYSATIREICMRAGANVAAVNYHFRDKIGLYTEVLQQSVRAAQIGAVHSALDLDVPPEEALRAAIRARLRSARSGNLPDWHVRIMAHELARPTPAMSRVLNKVSQPVYERLLELVGEIIDLPPDHETTRLCTHSVMGQIFLYVLAGPVLVRFWPELKMTPAQLDRIANHIADFSLAYLREVRSTHERMPRVARARRR